MTPRSIRRGGCAAPCLPFSLFLGAPAGGHPHMPPSIWVILEIKEKTVRMEVSARPEVVRKWLGESASAVEEGFYREALAAAVKSFTARGLLRLNGEATALEGERLEEFKADPGIDYVRIKFRFAGEERIRSAALRWDEFEDASYEDRPAIPVTVDAPGDYFQVDLSEKEPEYVWHAPQSPPKARPAVKEIAGTRARTQRTREERKLPVTSLGILVFGLAGTVVLRRRRAPGIAALALWLLAGGSAYALWDDTEIVPVEEERLALPSDEQAKYIFTALHGNIYRAFEARSEREIYSILQKSVHPSALDDLYADIYESLILREQGGAVARIQKVENLESHVDVPEDVRDRTGPPRFTVDWKWRVHCAISHWGHTHKRLNRYRARYTVRHDGEFWKIAEVEVLEHKRIDSNEGLEPEAKDGDSILGED